MAVAAKNTDIEEKDLVRIIDRDIIKWYFEYMRKYLYKILIILLFIIVTVVIEISLPLIIKNVIDDHINPEYFAVKISDKDLKKRLTENYKEILKYVGQDIFIFKRTDERFFLPKDKSIIYKIYLNESTTSFYYSDYNKLDIEKLNEINKEKFNGKIYLFEKGFLLQSDILSNADNETRKTLRQSDLYYIKLYAFLFVFLVITNFIFTYLQVYFIALVGQNVMNDIRNDLFAHIQKLPVSYFDETPVGVIVTRVTSDINNLQEFFSAVVLVLLKNFFIMGAIALLVVLKSPELSPYFFSLVPLLFLTTVFFRKFLRRAYRRIRKSVANINAFLTENINGISIIQMYGREKRNMHLFSGINHEYYSSFLDQTVLNSLFNPFIRLLRYLTLAILLFWGTGLVEIGTISVGVLVASLTFVEMFFMPIHEISEKIDIIESAFASSERIYNLLKMKTEDKYHESSQTVSMENLHGNITFENVTFAYKNDDHVLKDFNLDIKPGEHLAVVGHTGSGKTTIINLLLRYYEIGRGRILLDGIDIRNIPLDVLRNQIGMIQQDFFIFSGSVRDNILLGKPTATDDDIEKVASETNSLHFVKKLPKGFDTDLKEGGSAVSTGEKQLIAFARLLAYDSKIIILDEATSSIDTETEALIQDTLFKILKGKTAIIIAHRLSTIKNCDRIITLSKGRIVEMGSHKELMKMKGHYYKLYQLQYKSHLKKKEAV